MVIPPVDTLTFRHPHHSGLPVASSCAGPSPLDTNVAHEAVLRQTGYERANACNRNTLTFGQWPPGTPTRDALQAVCGAYQGCGRCHLSETRFQVVHHRGNPEAAVAFIGEGPGRDENDAGIPFVGRSGKLQDVCCSAAGMHPENDIFWMNVLGCRAAKHWSKDRPPSEAELVACSERTLLMLRAVRPRVVVCLGKVATRYFFAEPPKVWSWTRFVPREDPSDWVMVGHAYHPAYLARVIGIPSMYREYAAQRTFYSMLADQMRSGLQKVSAWRFPPRYLIDNLGRMVVSHHPEEDVA